MSQRTNSPKTSEAISSLREEAEGARRSTVPGYTGIGGEGPRERLVPRDPRDLRDARRPGLSLESLPSLASLVLLPPPRYHPGHPMLRSRALIFLLAGALLAGGCKAGPEAPPRRAPPPRRGGTAVVGWPAQPASVNELIVPPSQITKEVIFQMFLHLAEEQPDFQEHPASFKPTLAERWEWSADHKTLTFHLRAGVLWSDGVPVTADDVRWTWTAQKDPAIAWNEADAKKWMTDVEVVDPRTVRFHYSRVYAKQFLDANEGVILPRHAWEKIPFAEWRKSGDWFRQHLVVDGPFTLAAWEPQQQIVLQRNPRYYRQGYPLLDRVVIRQIADTAAGFTQMLSGDARLPAADQPRRRGAGEAGPAPRADHLLGEPGGHRRLEQRPAAVPRPRGAARPDPRHRPQDDRRHHPRPPRPGGEHPLHGDDLGPRQVDPAPAVRPRSRRGGSSPPRGGRTPTATASSTRTASPSPSS